MLNVVQVTKKRQLKKFINFPLKLYKGVKEYTPYLYEDELTNLTPGKNPASEWCDFNLFLVYEGDVIVGRICGIISHYANKKYNRKRVRFNRIDMIDDLNVTKALIDAVAEWGKSQGMTEIVGPLGYSDQDKEGLLVDGFEYMNMFATLYHFPYYQEHFLALGFVVDATWVENRIAIPKEIDERFQRVSEQVLKRTNLHVVELKNKAKLRPYIVKMLTLTNIAYADLYGYVPITERLMKFLTNQYLPLINLRYLILIADDNDEVKAFGLAIPSPIFALKKIKGRLYPFGFISFLRSLKKSKQLDMLLVAISPELRNSGLANTLLYEGMKHAIEDGIEYAETGPQLEYNLPIQNMWRKFDSINHKKRVCYLRPIA